MDSFKAILLFLEENLLIRYKKRFSFYCLIQMFLVLIFKSLKKTKTITKIKKILIGFINKKQKIFLPFFSWFISCDGQVILHKWIYYFFLIFLLLKMTFGWITKNALMHSPFYNPSIKHIIYFELIERSTDWLNSFKLVLDNKDE
jgi:hypothetical protein